MIYQLSLWGRIQIISTASYNSVSCRCYRISRIGIGLRRIRIRSIFVPAPFGNVARHIIQAPCIRLQHLNFVSCVCKIIERPRIFTQFFTEFHKNSFIGSAAVCFIFSRFMFWDNVLKQNKLPKGLFNGKLCTT